jgi:hypothetical protein
MIKSGQISNVSSNEVDVIISGTGEVLEGVMLMLPLGGEVLTNAVLSAGDNVVIWVDANQAIVLGVVYKESSKGVVKGVFEKLTTLLERLTFKTNTGATLGMIEPSLLDLKAFKDDLKKVLK